jgi:hypothetical protein
LETAYRIHLWRWQQALPTSLKVTAENVARLATVAETMYNGITYVVEYQLHIAIYLDESLSGTSLSKCTAKLCPHSNTNMIKISVPAPICQIYNSTYTTNYNYNSIPVPTAES